MQCLGCDGNGCDECGTSGYTTITGCPQRELTSDIFDLIEMSELYGKGLPPIAGGALDQTKSFIDAFRQLTRDQQTLKRALGII